MTDPWADVREVANTSDDREAFEDILADADALLAAVKEIEERADMYEKDGEPGPLGYNLWGWRIIAEELRNSLAALPEHLRGDKDERSRKA